MKVVIVGGGASGIIAALVSSKLGDEVVIIEKTNSIGKKLEITGKGRCNLTFDGDFDYFKTNIMTNPKFMYSSFYSFNNYDVIEFFEKMGIKVKLERGKRYFLENDNATKMVNVLLNELRKSNVKILYNTEVKEIITKDERFYSIKTDKEEILADKCIIATGGKTYPGTGSTGDGYDLVKKLGHNIIDVKGGLVPLKSNNKVCKELQGLGLKNIGYTLYAENKIIYTSFGELMFTHFGITGPLVLSSSSILNRVKNVDKLLKSNKVYVNIDLKPKLDFQTLDKRILRDFDKYNSKELKNGLNDLLPKRLIPIIIERSNINKNKKISEITKLERFNLVTSIKEFKINIINLMDISMGIITCGGIDLKEVNPRTLESKIIKDLYFAGEILDLDALTGGFNLQIAFSTGYLAANS